MINRLAASYLRILIFQLFYLILKRITLTSKQVVSSSLYLFLFKAYVRLLDKDSLSCPRSITLHMMTYDYDEYDYEDKKPFHFEINVPFSTSIIKVKNFSLEDSFTVNRKSIILQGKSQF